MQLNEPIPPSAAGQHSFLVLHHMDHSQHVVASLESAAALAGVTEVELLIAIEEDGVFQDGTVTVMDYAPASPQA